MSDSLTNRDAYQQVLTAATGTSRPLEEYLLALRLLVGAERDREALPPRLFADLLVRAMTEAAAPFDEAWRTTDFGFGDPGVTYGFPAWEQVVLSQIADLRDLADGPCLPDPELGVDAPRRAGGGSRATGRRWYNTTLTGYLECAMAGCFGGREPADWIRDLPLLTWVDLIDFLFCGQEYE